MGDRPENKQQHFSIRDLLGFHFLCTLFFLLQLNAWTQVLVPSCYFPPSISLSSLIIPCQLENKYRLGFLLVHQEFCQHLNRFNALFCLAQPNLWWLPLFLHHSFEKLFSLEENEEDKVITLFIRSRLKRSKEKCCRDEFTINRTIENESVEEGCGYQRTIAKQCNTYKYKFKRENW